MKKIPFIVLYLLIFCSITTAQENNAIASLQQHYQLFEYSKVVQRADELLLDKGRFSKKSLLAIYELKAASHFAMTNQQLARKAFIDLLKLDNGYELDDITYSPKLITFYKDVKKEFLEILELKDINPENDTIAKQKLSPIENLSENENEFPVALAKSILLPGLGHLHLEDNTKGWVLTTASTAILTSMIYFIADANSKETDYLAETNSQLIAIKYDEYNKSYNIRNLLIGTYAAIWIYSQIDILFFSNTLGSENISVKNTNNRSSFSNDDLVLSFKIPF